MKFACPALIAAMFLTASAHADFITTVTINPGQAIGAYLEVVPADYLGQPPMPQMGMFEDLILMLRSSAPPPLAFGPMFVYQTDTLSGLELPSNIYAYMATLPRTPATYHLNIANTSSAPYTLDLGAS
jgi:hypothetical protein